MSSQERNQEHATNWIVMKQDRRQRLYGPFSNAEEHRNSEAKIFANTILGEYFDPIPQVAKPRLESQMVDAVNDLFQMAGDPDFERPFPKLLPDSTPDDIVFTEQKITLNQGFQKDAAVAIKKLAAGEDMDEYRPPKEPKATYGDGLRIFYVSVRKAEMRWLDIELDEDIAKNPTKFSSFPFIMGAKAAPSKRYLLKDSNWRFDKYFEQGSFPYEIEGGVQVFVDKDKAIEYAEAEAGKNAILNVESPRSLAEERVVYEVPSEDETAGPLRGLPKHFMLYAVTTARINKTGRVPEWCAL
ncbi:hypothetical protein J4E83_002908 [Alternaria metachromatica]|uniref:uncharacterized protein n=1 Tax=Alternaria metachromatica TaxID=283354 RepID=UPI0020C431D0|nr:uncharacterized protein J4E83_002908 [Alternaria metachromatica]KAI4631377.1 hypothetical protein J4E83_002908 [Alternaria metachromatica]